MTQKGKYMTGLALRAALEERLKQMARAEGIALQRLRRQVAFDRFLARLFHRSNTQWVLKGGYAMELRFEVARTTRDLDFTLRAASAGASDALLGQIQGTGILDLGDFFLFRVGAPIMDLEGAPYGGFRYPVEARMAERTFVKFHLDVGVGDVVLDPLEQTHTRDWLAFAGIPPGSVWMIQRGQQFAEKLHAYTFPRTVAPNSRVRDLIDMVLLIQSGTLDSEQVVEALRRTFQRRETHPLPTVLAPPPINWSEPFQALAEECRLEISVDEAFAIVWQFYVACRKRITDEMR